MRRRIKDGVESTTGAIRITITDREIALEHLEWTEKFYGKSDGFVRDLTNAIDAAWPWQIR